MTATKPNPLNLPPDVTLDASIADAAARAEEYTIVRREKLGVGHFFRDPRRVKSKHPLPWFWHRYTPDGNDSGWGENKNECVFRILTAAAPPKTPPLVVFTEHIIADTLRMCMTEPSAERRLLAEFIIKQAFAAVGTQDPGLRADWKSMLAGIGLGGIATYAAMAGKEQK